MTVTLIGSLTSPYVRKARIVLAEKKIDYTFEVDDPWNAQSRVADANPLGKVPVLVLVLEDGSTLFDSRVIVEFLDSVSPISRLIPANNREKSRSSAGRRWLTGCSTRPWPSSSKTAARPNRKARN